MNSETADTGFLTARQEAFCRAFVSGGSAVAAARAAGYAETTARAQAARLLQHPNIQHRIEQLRADEDGAKAALCGRLLEDVHAIREGAMESGDWTTALRAINTTLRVVRQFGMPATPPDTRDVLLEAAHAGADGDDPGLAYDDAPPEAPTDAVPLAEPDIEADPAAETPSPTDPDMDAAIAETVAAGIDPASDAALARDPAGPDGDRLRAMLADVGECRSDTAAAGPTSAELP